MAQELGDLGWLSLVPRPSPLVLPWKPEGFLQMLHVPHFPRAKGRPGTKT